MLDFEFKLCNMKCFVSFSCKNFQTAKKILNFTLQTSKYDIMKKVLFLLLSHCRDGSCTFFWNIHKGYHKAVYYVKYISAVFASK